MSDSSKKLPSIPSWQQSYKSDSESPATEHQHAADPSTQLTHEELLEQARVFLKDESIRSAPRDRKVTFLQRKGLQADDIEQLLGEDTDAPSEEQAEELKTVHDSNKDDNNINTPPTEPPNNTKLEISAAPSPKPTPRPQRDVPPIITYPEFLLKPQKPPPLITIPRLINGAYAFAGLATLTYSASKYIVEPMLETLTEARHSLASSTIADLETLNTKLESTVSHVPYIASAAALRKSQDQERNVDEDNESTTSDPTELFHRDIATQTTPTLSRTQSHDNDDDSKTHLDATTQQVQRLSSLHETLTSLVYALDPKELPYMPPPANKVLRDTISDFQTVLDKLEATFNPFRGDYYSSIYAQPTDNKSKSGGKDNDIAAKVRADIRSLKGAFLSARNFPTAPRPANTYMQR